MIIEYLIWAPDRETFLTAMQGLTNPVTETPLIDEDGNPSHCVRVDEIGPIVKSPATYDEDGNEIIPAEIVTGHHVNMAAYGELADLLTAGMPSEGTVFETTRILDLLGDMTPTESQVGEPHGLVGASGVKVFGPSAVDRRYRVWA